MQKIIQVFALFALGSAASPLFAGCGGPDLARLRAAALVSGSNGNAAAASDVSAASGEFLNTEPWRAPIVGLWDIKFYSGGQLVDEGFDAWHGDGTEILNDTPPPATGNVCLGVWMQTAHAGFHLKHPSWLFDQITNTQIVGQAVIRENVTVSKDGNSFAGTYTLDIYDTFGNLQEHFAGQVKATRIKPD